MTSSCPRMRKFISVYPALDRNTGRAGATRWRASVARRRVVYLDVVHGDARRLALFLDHVGDGGLGQHRARGVGGVEEDAFRAAAERAVEELDDLQHGDLRRGLGERVAALDAALGLQQAGA